MALKVLCLSDCSSLLPPGTVHLSLLGGYPVSLPVSVQPLAGCLMCQPVGHFRFSCWLPFGEGDSASWGFLTILCLSRHSHHVFPPTLFLPPYRTARGAGMPSPGPSSPPSWPADHKRSPLARPGLKWGGHVGQPGKMERATHNAPPKPSCPVSEGEKDSGFSGTDLCWGRGAFYNSPFAGGGSLPVPVVGNQLRRGPG